MAQLSVLGPLSFIVFIGCVSYAILKHRFLDIHIIVRRSLIYTLLLSTVFFVFGLVAVWGPNFFFGRQEPIELDDLIVVLALVFFIPPLQRWFENVTDRIFFKSKYDVQQTIFNLSAELNSLVGVDELENKLIDTVVGTMKISGMAVLREYFTADREQRFALGNQKGFEKKDLLRHTDQVDSPCYQYFFEQRDIVVLDELKRSLLDRERGSEHLYELKRRLADTLASLGAEVAIPLFSKKHLIGAFLLKGKLSGDAFSSQDLELLEILSHQSAVALDNALLYSGLEERVQERTEQLDEKNRYLTTLQRVTNQVIQSLDFGEITQRIVNAVHTEMGYVGAFLLSYTEITGEIHLAAITKLGSIENALKKMGDVSNIRGTIDSDNLTTEALKKKETRSSDKLGDFLKPIVLAKLANATQKAIKAKAVIAVPIMFADQVYGTLNFLSAKQLTEITATEKEMMNSLAQLVAIVLRNTQYYEEVQDSNKRLQNAYQMINEQLTQLEEANRHLQKLDKAKTEFLSIASHQLRTPLSAIRGYLSLLGDGDYGELTEKQISVLHKTDDNVRRLVSLVSDLLSLARIEAGTGPKGLNIEEVDFRELVNLTVDELALKARNKGLEIRWQTPKEPVRMEMDREKMEQVVMNLIDNALNYTIEGFVHVELESSGDKLVFKVHDTGIGLEQDEIDNLFTKFYRSTDAIKVKPDGTGIGLYVCKTIVESHSGTVKVESERGQGSTFIVELPVHQPQIEQEDEKENS